MTTASNSRVSVDWFQMFKYSVYALLITNIYLFFREEWQASQHLFADGPDLAQIIEAFAATIDTAAWVVLLLLFELETSVISDHRIHGPVKWLLHGVRLVCYGFIFYAFYGYAIKCLAMYEYTAAAHADLCDIAGQAFSLLVDLDEFEPVTAANCQLASGVGWLSLPGTAVFAAENTWLASLRLAWLDVINSGAWIIVVAVLEIDVRLQLRGKLSGVALSASTATKAVLYCTLLAAAVYWGVAGDFLDFWDAFLWILAFVAIEMNVFEWRAETSQSEAGVTLQPTS